jgi:hypothetical protein
MRSLLSPASTGCGRVALLRRVSLVVGPVLLLCACGRGSPADQVRDVVKTTMQAIADDDASTACQHMTGNAKRQMVRLYASLGANTCESAVHTAAGQLGPEERSETKGMRIGKVNIHNDRAEVPDSSFTDQSGKKLPDDDPASMWLQEFQGEWLIDDLG